MACTCTCTGSGFVPDWSCSQSAVFVDLEETMRQKLTGPDCTVLSGCLCVSDNCGGSAVHCGYPLTLCLHVPQAGLRRSQLQTGLQLAQENDRTLRHIQDCLANTDRHLSSYLADHIDAQQIPQEAQVSEDEDASSSSHGRLWRRQRKRRNL